MAATPLQAQTSGLTLVWPRGAPSTTSGRAGPPAGATGWLGAGTDLGQERVPSRWACAHSPGWAGLGGLPPLYAPSQSIPEGRQYHQRTWEMRPCTHVGGGRERQGRAFRPHPPHQTQDGGFSGLNPLSQYAPSHPPGLTDQASHLTGSLGSAPPAASSFCTPPSLASPGIRERRSAQMHLLQAQPRRAAVLMACCLLVSPSDPTP